MNFLIFILKKYKCYVYPIKKNTTSVLIYKTLLLKSWELRKLIFVLKLFVITIVFTILSLRESWFMFSICYLLMIEEENV